MHARNRNAALFAGILLMLPWVPAEAIAGQKPKEWGPVINPAEFVSTVDNPYFPLTPGSTMRYSNASGTETLVVEVTSRTRTIMGVRTVVVIETASENGQVVEIAENWFAQHRTGDVWYFGEATQDYENGVPTSTAGSWEAGVQQAVPGIVMKAQPQPGDSYFQEYAPGVAEDMANVQGIGWSIVTPLGSYSDVLKVKEWTPLEPNSLEHKYYARGVGLIREEKGGQSLDLIATN